MSLGHGAQNAAMNYIEGVTGSRKVEGRVEDVVVMPVDGKCPKNY